MVEAIDVYRVQHQIDNKGPYCLRGQDTCHAEEAGMLNASGVRHPIPWRDPESPTNRGIMPMENYYADESKRHGFASLDALRLWFHDDERTVLGKLGYVVMRYRVKPHGCNERTAQTVFHLSHAIRDEAFGEVNIGEI